MRETNISSVMSDWKVLFTSFEPIPCLSTHNVNNKTLHTKAERSENFAGWINNWAHWYLVFVNCIKALSLTTEQTKLKDIYATCRHEHGHHYFKFPLHFYFERKLLNITISISYYKNIIFLASVTFVCWHKN